MATSWRTGHHATASRCLSATGIRFSVILCPPGSWALLTVGLPTRAAGPRRGFHVPHARAATGLGALLTPGTTVLTPTEATNGRAPAASQRPVPAPRSNTPPRGASHNEASTRVHAIRPSGLPRACGRPDGSGQPLGSTPGLRTPPAKSWTTHARVGTGHRARTWNYRSTHHQSISNPIVHSLRATSVVAMAIAAGDGREP